MLVLGVGCWVLGVGCWVLGVGCWVLGVGCWVLGVGCWDGDLEIIYVRTVESSLTFHQNPNTLQT